MEKTQPTQSFTKQGFILFSFPFFRGIEGSKVDGRRKDAWQTQTITSRLANKC